MNLCCQVNGLKKYSCQRCKQPMCSDCGPQRLRIKNPKYEDAKELLRKQKIYSWKDDRKDGKSIKTYLQRTLPKEVSSKLHELSDPLEGSCGYRYFFYMPLLCNECYRIVSELGN